MSEITASGCLFYAKSTKRFLFLNRQQKQKGTWGMVGGSTHDTESPWQGLQREIVEEIGFQPTISKTIPLELFVSKDTRFKFHTFVCVVDQEFVPKLNVEHSTVNAVHSDISALRAIPEVDDVTSLSPLLIGPITLTSALPVNATSG